MQIDWLTAFLDTPVRATPEVAESFWRHVTDTVVSPRRGDEGEFATLLPRSGDAFLRVQRTKDGPVDVHLDLHVAQPFREVASAEAAGAQVVALQADVATLRSPGGLLFCLAPPYGDCERPTATHTAAGYDVLLDQVCIDAPAHLLEAEVAFWSALTGWAAAPASAPEFCYLRRPPDMPLRLLFQRLGDPVATVRAHLDLACTNVDAEVRRHEQAGATLVRRTPVWTTMRDPVGREYCITSRNPVSGKLPRSPD